MPHWNVCTLQASRVNPGCALWLVDAWVSVLYWREAQRGEGGWKEAYQEGEDLGLGHDLVGVNCVDRPTTQDTASGQASPATAGTRLD